MALTNQIRWRDRFPRRSWRLVMKIDNADEVPSDLPRRGVVLVGSMNLPKWLVFDCPCRRGHRVMLNLDVHRRPTWKMVNQRPLTTSPSIDDYAIDRCHFFIRNGKIQWATNSIEVNR
jgi:Family of unknown function (DUF6527)